MTESLRPNMTAWNYERTSMIYEHKMNRLTECRGYKMRTSPVYKRFAKI